QVQVPGSPVKSKSHLSASAEVGSAGSSSTGKSASCNGPLLQDVAGDQHSPRDASSSKTVQNNLNLLQPVNSSASNASSSRRGSFSDPSILNAPNLPGFNPNNLTNHGDQNANLLMMPNHQM
ncbi:unnamed protein product, partial [Amoebophrya sp. A120]